MTRSVGAPKLAVHLLKESTCKALLAVHARYPAVDRDVDIAIFFTLLGGFLPFRKLRQTFDVNEASAIAAASASPQELRRFPIAISFKANVAPVTIFFQFFL